MYKKLVVLFALLFIGVAFAKINTVTKGVRSQRLVRKEIPISPTAIDDRELSDRQKAHSKLFKGYDQITSGRKLKDMALGQDVNLGVDVGDVAINRQFNRQAYLAQVVCKADAIVIARVNTKEAQIIEDGTFVFTDYNVIVEQVLKNNSSFPMNSGDGIVVTRAGGAVRYHAHIIKTIDAATRPLEPRRRYIMFLDFIPETGAYRTVQYRNDNTFVFAGDTLLMQISDSSEPFGGRDHVIDSVKFIAEINSSLKRQCGN